MSQQEGPIYRIGSPPSGLAKPPRNTKKLIIALIAVSTLAILSCCAGIAILSRLAPSKVENATDTQTDGGLPAAQPNPPSTAQTTAPALRAEPPADQTFSGKGDKVVKLNPLDEDFFHLAVIIHKGSSNFVVIALDTNGEHLDLIVNEIGSYGGTRPISARGFPAALEIKASGTWSITVQVAQKAPVWSGSVSGKGDAVYLVAPGTVSGLTTVKISHTGKSNFVVTAYGRRSDLLVNEIGAYTGEVVVPSGTGLLEIVADGAWTMTKS